jgi:hypothetical protein
MTIATQPDPDTLSALKNLVDTPEQGTILTVQVHKMGEERGPAGDKRVYGDDIKQVLIWTGFSHLALIQRSMKILSHQLGKGGYIEKIARATLEVHEGTTIEDVCHALQEVRDSFRHNLAMGYEPMDGDAPTPGSPYWGPLIVEGVKVRGCSVYNGPARPDTPRAPVPGTVYVRGLKLGEKMVTPAPNGQWMADSKPKTLAKRIILEGLPMGLYCQYRLDPSRVSGLAVAADAVKVARDMKIPIDPAALISMFKVG